MIGIIVKGPNQEQNFVGIQTPCVLGRQADVANPDVSLSDPFASRRHIELVQQEAGKILVRCIGSSAVGLASGDSIEPATEQAVELPVELRIGRSTIFVEAMNVNVSFLKPRVPTMAGQPGGSTSDTLHLAAGADVETQRLIDWFEEIIALQESAIGTQGFYEQAANAVVDMIGLDRCVVLSYSGGHSEGHNKGHSEGQWNVEVQHGQQQPGDVTYSQSVVDHVWESGKTVFDDSIDLSAARSLSGVSAFVGSPIFDGDGNVVACLFGVRNLDPNVSTQGIRQLEAQLVQVIAGIVGSRMARMAAEAEQTRTQVQLEQFASPQLVREMQSNPQWLDAQQRELSLMFGDIRGFSRLSESLTAQQIYTFVRDTMDCMTNAIHQHGGFVFNYAGDGIAAMWNAPGQTASHASEACQAAIAVQRALAEVDQQWAEAIGKPVQVGLGINTGTALIGNSGSKSRLHYSPLGHSVNLASRVEGATKHFGARVLITEATRSRVESDFVTRDLGEIVVVGIDQSARVFELAVTDDPSDHDHWSQYEETLHMLEHGDEQTAVARINELVVSYPDDGAVKVLVQRLANPTGSGEPWVLPQK